jgi:hypothetical protein
MIQVLEGVDKDLHGALNRSSCVVIRVHRISRGATRGSKQHLNSLLGHSFKVDH